MRHSKTDDPKYRLVDTRFGPVAVLWSVHSGEPRVLRVVLPKPEDSGQQCRARVYPAPKQRNETVLRPGINPGPTSGFVKQAISGLELANHDEGSCEAVDQVAKQLIGFVSGEDIGFSLEIVRLDLCPAFQRKVLLAEQAIPRGSVSTYTRIARRVACPKGARAVGNALAKNPFPLIVPCHRAVREDLSLGGFQGGLDMKRELLEMEGFEFDQNGRIMNPSFSY